MKRLLLCVVALAAMFGTGARAQDLSGNWQGTLKAGKDLRVIFNFYKGDKDPWNAKMYSIDQGGQVIPVTSVTRRESSIKISVDMIGGTFEGKLSEDGRMITGTWTQGMQPLPLTLVRATPETAWDIPAPPPPPKRIPADANPTFEVATIKPTQEGTHFSIHPTGSGELVATDASLAYLIKFAYEVHPRQITKGPAWLDTDKYDLTAKPDMEGQPNLKQMRVMVQKLLADRLQLTFHREKIELPVYAVTVAKGGPKLARNESNPDGNPGYGGGPAGMRVVNSTIEEFISFVLNDSVGLPVVDQTGLGSARYNFVLKWTPDASQSQPGGAAGAPPADNADAPPDIFTAMQQQLGLKLESTKALVDVMVIDHVEKPSPN
jgi:bla regulator protein blaR1